MEIIKGLLIRFRQSGIMLFIGFIVIIYIAFGFIYWQQSTKQNELEKQLAQVNLIINKSLTPKDQLEKEYSDVNSVLAPMTDIEAIALIVSIAENNGITIDNPEKFNVPSVNLRKEIVGASSYEVLSFQNIIAQGNHDSIISFISDLDTGTTQKNIVLKSVSLSQVEVIKEGSDITTTETKTTMNVDIYTKS
ncbi:hypothetical protein ACFLXP_03405 [Chloroflexota bacterium]